ncbi:MAG: Lrp/AsnC ligand binding domain-containing protein [Pseudomonadota bacterium]
MNDSDDLDDIDFAILRILGSHARISTTELSQRVGLSKTPVAGRVKRMERVGIITGYRAELSAQKLGLEHVAFVQVSLSDTRERALRAFNEGVRGIAEVEECHMIAGNFDYLVKVRTTDITAYRRVLSEQISQLPHVASTSTFVSMEPVRERKSVL